MYKLPPTKVTMHPDRDLFFILPPTYLTSHGSYVHDTGSQTARATCSMWRKSHNGSFPIFKDLRTALTVQASENAVIVLPSIVDRGYLTMAINFYLTSILPHGIHNVLFICADSVACDELRHRCIPSFLYVQDPTGGGADEYLSADFNRKGNLKLWVVRDIIRLGYTVLITDLDVVFFKDPLPYLSGSMSDMHVMLNRVLSDGRAVYNSGFMYVRNTTKSQLLFNKIIQRLESGNPKDHDQKVLNIILSDTTVKQSNLSLNVLPPELFSTGYYYFELMNRIMYDPKNVSTSCVVLHNNFVTGVVAKEFRLKEHMLWHYEEDGYYSESGRKYMTYYNPYELGNSTYNAEEDALKNALMISAITNRTLIMPRFHCFCTAGGCAYHCPLDYHFHMATFFSYFGGKYRENSFLINPKTKLKQYLSSEPKITILVKTNEENPKRLETLGSRGMQNRTVIMRINENNQSPTQEILNILEPFRQSRLLIFSELYGVFWRLGDTPKDQSMKNKLEKALQYSDARQFKHLDAPSTR